MSCDAIGEDFKMSCDAIGEDLYYS